MPLTFETLSHGTIAFGFFNIETDMLLLEQYFFFGSEFCQHIGEMAENVHTEKFATHWPVYAIADRTKIGDLMGAIYGTCYAGFMGELYRRYPFPVEPEAFKQNPEGYLNQSIVREMISEFATPVRLPVKADHRTLVVTIGEYQFNRQNFQELVKYIWRGGYPRWREDIPPIYVLEMKNSIGNHQLGLFENTRFD